jgi:hypothetical protein
MATLIGFEHDGSRQRFWVLTRSRRLSRTCRAVCAIPPRSTGVVPLKMFLERLRTIGRTGGDFFGDAGGYLRSICAVTYGPIAG